MHENCGTQTAALPVTGKGPTAAQDLLKGIWKENPVLVQLLGGCSTLAVTNSVVNGLAMGLATLFVLVFSSLFVSSLRKVIPNEVRISTYVLIIATFTTLADMGLEALVPETHKALGAFIALIVANCIVLGRQEAFSAKNNVWRSVLDALGMGLGFTLTLTMMGAIRELLGAGSFFGYNVFGPRFEPWVIMVLPPGGFFTLGAILLWLGWWRSKSEARAREKSSVPTIELHTYEAPAGPAKVA